MKKLVLLVLLAMVPMFSGLVAVAETQPNGQPPASNEDRTQDKNADDRLADIGVRVPGFGGMNIDPTNPSVLNVFFLDTTDEQQKTDAEYEINSKFPGTIPSGGIAVLQGQYSMSQLIAWYVEVLEAIPAVGLLVNGLLGTDLEEDKNRLEGAVENEEAVALVEIILARLSDVPRDAVRITIRGRFRFLSGSNSGSQTVQDRI